MLKVISLWEPWATLMAIEAKRIETRGWSTDFRGEVAIHSTKGGLSKRNLKETCEEPYFIEELTNIASFNHGCIIAVGTLTDCLPTVSHLCVPGVFDDYPYLKTPEEQAFGDYAPGRYGLVFENVTLLQEPIPFKSRQGKLLDLDFDTEQRVRGAWW